MIRYLSTKNDLTQRGTIPICAHYDTRKNKTGQQLKPYTPHFLAIIRADKSFKA
jgi:hypothetical protein